jgi:hypothetical protein
LTMLGQPPEQQPKFGIIACIARGGLAFAGKFWGQFTQL